MRDKYTIDGQFLDHEHDVTDFDGEGHRRIVTRYWVPTGGGYVWRDTSRHLTKPATLGHQPVDQNGNTWRASTIQEVKAMVMAEQRRFRRALARH